MDPTGAPKRRKVDGVVESRVSGVFRPSGTALEHRETEKFKIPGAIVQNHIFKVPLDHSGEVPGEIEIFARELVSPANVHKQGMTYIVYLQGGPGFEAPRPGEISGWMAKAIGSFRIILLDQRGTGKSSPITVKNLAKKGTPQQQAEYLSFFRADSIVRDAEIVRKALVPKDSYNGRWAVLGQSFGGFCAVTYMSIAPEGLLEVMLTGGIPPNIHEPCPAEDVYRALATRVLSANQRYYARFPSDVQAVQKIVRFLASQPEGGVPLPSGSLLTPRAFQTLGLSGLGSGGGFERLHYLLETFWDDEDQEDINPSFIKSFESWQPWEVNPLYALLHEAIYCQGAASNWAAHHVIEQEFSAQFDAVGKANAGKPVMFLGEMVFPWFFDDFAGLRPFKECAHILAAKNNWGTLYNSTVLARNIVPAAAATYVEDMYVDFNLAQSTAGRVNGLRQWMTNEYKHSGIRDDGGKIFDRLLSMVRDTLLQE